MKELKLNLAGSLKGRPAPEAFRIVTEESVNERYQAARLRCQGQELANLLFDNLPGAVVFSLVKQLHARYAHFNFTLNPFVEGVED